LQRGQNILDLGGRFRAGDDHPTLALHERVQRVAQLLLGRKFFRPLLAQLADVLEHDEIGLPILRAKLFDALRFDRLGQLAREIDYRRALNVRATMPSFPCKRQTLGQVRLARPAGAVKEDRVVMVGRPFEDRTDHDLDQPVFLPRNETRKRGGSCGLFFPLKWMSSVASTMTGPSLQGPKRIVFYTFRGTPHYRGIRKDLRG
jgi:hypothetical protein